jgi:hypothetical protein
MIDGDKPRPPNAIGVEKKRGWVVVKAATTSERTA